MIEYRYEIDVVFDNPIHSLKNRRIFLEFSQNHDAISLEKKQEDMF